MVMSVFPSVQYTAQAVCRTRLCVLSLWKTEERSLLCMEGSSFWYLERNKKRKGTAKSNKPRVPDIRFGLLSLKTSFPRSRLLYLLPGQRGFAAILDDGRMNGRLLLPYIHPVRGLVIAIG